MSGLLALVLATTLSAHAQACVCSRNVALPSGNINRPGELVLALDQSLAVWADPDAWNGFVVTDRAGDSMAGMAMPVHLVSATSAGAALGLPGGFALSASLPYVVNHPIGPSEMGDMHSNSLGDADLTAKYAHKTKDSKAFLGGSLGMTMPTGKVTATSPVRAGRGAFGVTGGLQAGAKVSPHTALVLSSGFGAGLSPDPYGYRVGASLNGVAGVRWSPRENGRVSFGVYDIVRHVGEDRINATTYEDTGYTADDLALGAGFTVWEHELRAASVNASLQAPLWQFVGDPMYAENVVASVGLRIVAR